MPKHLNLMMLFTSLRSIAMLVIVAVLILVSGPAHAVIDYDDVGNGNFYITNADGDVTQQWDFDTWNGMARSEQSRILLECGAECQVRRQNPIGIDEGWGGALTDQVRDSMTSAQALYLYAMGEIGTNSCISCDVLAYFMIGLAKFSFVVHGYFAGAFTLLVPLMMAIWIGYRVSKLMAMGGEDGRSFIYSIAQKSALFAIIWLMASANVTTTSQGRQAMDNPWLWETSGPIYLNYAFELSTSLRNTAFSAAGAGSDPFNCDAVAPSTGPLSNLITGRVNSDNTTDFIQSALEVGCVTERVHMIGIASGIAVIFSSYTETREGNNWYERIGYHLAFAMVSVASGAMMVAVFALSAVWLTFLVLDIVVRGLITAAFAPAIAAAYLWVPSRSTAVNAIKGLVGALVTAVGISMVSTLAYFLLTNVIAIYNALVPTMQALEPNLTIETINTGSMVGDYSTFLERIQEDNDSKPVVPMNLSTPYFYYMCLAGVTTFALGKKMIAMLESMIGVQGFSAFADNAMKLTRSGAMLGMGAAGVAGIGMMAAGGATVGAAGFAMQGGRKLLPGLGAALGGAGQGAGLATNNPWGMIAATNMGKESLNAAQE